MAVLLEMVKKLSRAGTTIIYISHRLEEVVEIAEDITVLRDGRAVHTGPMKGLEIPDIVKQMVGRDLDDYFPKRKVRSWVHGSERVGTLVPKRRKHQFRSATGERSSASPGWWAQVALSLPASCAVWTLQSAAASAIDGKSVKIATPADALSCGIMYVTEDRKRTGLCLDLPAAWNMTLPCLAELGMKHILHLGRENEIAEETAKKLSLKWSGPGAPASALSGGNQQKLLLGRAIIAQSRLWVLDEPTRGIDIAAKVDIYELIGRMVAEGKAVLIISSELPELFGITDRILVMRRGRLVADLVTSETTQEAVMQSRRRGQGPHMNKLVRELLPFGSLVLVIAILSLWQPDSFLTLDNFLNVLRRSSVYGIIAVGMTFVIISGGIDLSVGSLLALCGMCAAGTMIGLGGEEPTVGMMALGTAVGLLTGAVGGLVSGALITKLKLQPFIATLGTMSLYRGIALVMYDGQPINV